MVHKGSIKELLVNIVYNYFIFFAYASFVYIAFSPIISVTDIIISYQWYDCELDSKYTDTLVIINIIGVIVTIIYNMLHISGFFRIISDEKDYEIVSFCSPIIIFGVILIIYVGSVFIISFRFSVELLERGPNPKKCHEDQFNYIYLRYILLTFSLIYLTISYFVMRYMIHILIEQEANEDYRPQNSRSIRRTRNV